MKTINDCLKLIATDCGWKYITYDNGKLIQLINREGQSVAVYDHFFPLNSDTTARICDDRSLKCKLLKKAGILCDENYEIAFTSRSRLLADLEPMLEKYGELILKSNYRRDKFITKISGKNELEQFVNTKHKFDTVLVNQYIKYEHFYSVFIVGGIAELIVEYSKPQIIGDGVSAIWELLSLANITTYDENIDLNKVLERGEVLNTSWQIKATDSKIKVVDDNEIIKKLSTLSLSASRVLGMTTGTIDIYKQDGQYFIQSIDTSLNADLLLNDTANQFRVIRLYEKAVRLLI